MSFLGGIGRGRGPVTHAPTADNRKLERADGLSSLIKSAKWERSHAGLNDNVKLIIVLNKQAISKNASVEVFFNGSGLQSHPFDNPLSIPVTGTTFTGTWRTKAPKIKNWTSGHFTFRVKLDGQMLTSDALRLTDDPVARAVRRINSDGFDR